MIDASTLSALSLDEKRELLKNLLSLQAGTAKAALPLSYGQQALWFLHQMAPASPAYNFLYVARIRVEIDADIFRRACRTLLDRHTALRTRFVVKDHKPVRQIDDAVSLNIPLTDATGWDDDRLLELCRQRADEPFKLEEAPCLRIELFRHGPADTVILLVFHHIIADLWSADLLLHELAELYGSLSASRAARLPAAPADFSDFVRAEMVHAHSERGLKSRDYWHHVLKGELPVLELPTDRPRPPVQTYRGTAHSWSLSRELSQGVRRLAKEQSSTPFAVLLAAYQLFLSRLSGQDDVLIATPVATREHHNWERVVGYFLNQVALRARFTTDRPFRSFVEETRDQVHQVLEHQAYPFGLLVKQLQPKRDPSRAPIFQAMFVWDKPRSLPAVGGAAFELETMLMEQRGAPFDVTLIIFEFGEELIASFRYNADLFDAATIERWAGHFTTLLEALLRSPDMSLSEAPLLSPEERETALTAWNATQTPYPREPLCRQFEEHVRRAPHAIALLADDQAVSYAEVDRRANQLARHLQERGVRPGDLVVISLPRGADIIITVLAAWKAGAAYLFIDPTYPRKRRDLLLAEARPTAIVAASVDRDPSTAAIVLPADWPQIERQSADGVAITDAPELRAYIIYTSGSTGEPKGVVLRHGGLANLAEAQRQLFRCGPGDRVLQFAPLSFDASVWEMAMAFGSGATLVVATQAGLLPGQPLLDVLRDQEITNVTLPPSVLALLPVEPLPALRTLIVAGEACTVDLVSTWAPGRRFFNAYGPTETTVCATAALCTADGKTPTIGRPIANTRVYVLDRDLQPVPIGVAGELYVAGAGLALGYLERPDLTAERFLPNPFDAADDGVMYRTGDVARWTPTGELEFRGRVDAQVKYRGHRIELDEIRHTLCEHPGVTDVAVLIRQEPGQCAALVAYVVSKAGDDTSAANLRAFLRERLPHYMLPGAIVPLRELPLTHHGKLDRDRLPSPGECEANPCARGAPRTARERLLAKIWAQVLKVDRVGIHDHFFDLGGASLQTLEVVELARKEGVSLTPEMLFRYQTVAELAAASEESVAPALADHTPAKNGVKSPKPECAAAPVEAAAPAAKPGARIESLAAYLPPRELTTAEMLRGCRKPIDFPLERLTGIHSRRVAGETEFSFELAEQAVADCLPRSRYEPSEVDLVICCNISRCDGPMHRFALEPTFAARLVQRFGLVNAVAFDLTNACAGTFTGIHIANALIRDGVIERALIVSGEYITHLTTAAQKEIENFMDPRLACLTLGDSGVAMMLDRSADPAIGFQDLELYTIGKYHDLCVAKLSEAGGGPIMHTDSVTSTAVTLRQAVGHAMEVLQRQRWDLDKLDALIVHQTSATTLDGAMREINQVAGRSVCHRGNMVYNVAERGNTATNTHMLATWERIQTGDLHAGDRAVFAVSGSGQTVGTALYVFDDLPERLRQPLPPNGHAHAPVSAEPIRHFRCRRPVRVAALGTASKPGDTLTMVQEAGEDCLRQYSLSREEIDLILFSGVYRSEFLSEPAVAAIAAGTLGINHEEGRPGAPRTLAFDILNGGAGTVTACFVAAELIGAGTASHALVLAAEIEHNRVYWPEQQLGLVETGSALVLEASLSSEGFTAFASRNFPEHVGAIASQTGPRDNHPAVFHHRDAGLDDRLVSCACELAREFLQREGLMPADVSLVVPPQRPGDVGRRIVESLAIDPARLVSVEPAGEYYTSSLAYAMNCIRQEKRVSPGDRVLFIEVSAGLQVWCALYQA
jgi:amino acid adenylation domain-containing protein